MLMEPSLYYKYGKYVIVVIECFNGDTWNAVHGYESHVQGGRLS